MTLYKGNQKIRDTGSYGVYHGNTPILAIYKGSELVYQFLPSGQTFNPSSSLQTYTVPQGCTKLLVDCVAAKGYNGKVTGGNGGRVQCTLTVTPGQTLYLFVAPEPTSQDVTYNASDIRTDNTGVTDNTSLQSRLVVAGGGGYGGNGGSQANTTYNGNGGAGGGTTGAKGDDAYACVGGSGGTQSAGGAKGYGTAAVAYDGRDGEFGLGGSGTGTGGSGGSGWYGGGSGGGWSYYDSSSAGGGGGSSYTDATLCSNVTHTQGYQNGAGYITITPTH